MPAPVATWNSQRDVWELETMDLFSGHSDVYSETWPISGTTRAGRAYARPMWAHLTAGSESLSSPGLLPTPDAYAGSRGGAQHPDKRREGGHSASLQNVAPTLLPTPAACVANDGESTETWLARREQVKATGVNGNGMGMPLTIAVQLLPTPTTQDAANLGGPSQFERNSLPLNTAVLTLLPTPRATDGYKGGPNQRGSSGDLMLPSAVQQLGDSTQRLSDGGSAA